VAGGLLALHRAHTLTQPLAVTSVLPSQSYTHYEVLVLVAAGIGVTPMASILRHLTTTDKGFTCR
jgi:hypothetical protein